MESENLNGSFPLQEATPENKVLQGRRNHKRKELISIGCVVILIIIIITSTFFYTYIKRGNPNGSGSISKNNSDKRNNEFSENKFKTLSLHPINLNDPKTNIFFADTNKVYKMTLDGSSPKELARFLLNIESLSTLNNGDQLIAIGKHVSVKVINKKLSDPDYKEVSSESHYYTLHGNSKKEISSSTYGNLLSQTEINMKERIYTKELGNGQADILVDMFDGREPTKIGVLKEKIIKEGCEWDPCPVKKFPSEFLPSLDGSYLINDPPGGGGLGETAVVISRDGTRVYNIDFYWYTTSAVWIGNDKLLTKGQGGKQKLITFKEDGTFEEKDFIEDFGNYFSFKDMSPTKEYILLHTRGFSLYNFSNHTFTTIQQPDNHEYKLLGWNLKGDKFIYSDTLGQTAEVRKVNLYDINTGKTYMVADISPFPGAEEAWVKGVPVASFALFSIR